MKSTENYTEVSYRLHREHYNEPPDERMQRVYASWFAEDTVDYWRHFRSVMPLKPLLDCYKDDKWLTIGDGRFGLDAIRLRKIQPQLNVLPTDISTNLLAQAKELKMISDFREENAEALSFGDNSFDFCFCKESYHHFPRPYIALYEMLRVAKKAVILIEPNDIQDKMIPEQFYLGVKQLIKKIIGRRSAHKYTWDFESTGNFIYKVSQNEMEKLALGLALPAVAFYYFNDYYESDVEFEKAVPGNKLFEKVKREIRKADMKRKLGINNNTGIVSIIFKQPVDPVLRKQLKENKFEVIDLPENFHMKK